MHGHANIIYVVEERAFFEIKLATYRSAFVFQRPRLTALIQPALSHRIIYSRQVRMYVFLTDIANILNVQLAYIMRLSPVRGYHLDEKRSANAYTEQNDRIDVLKSERWRKRKGEQLRAKRSESGLKWCGSICRAIFHRISDGTGAGSSGGKKEKK